MDFTPAVTRKFSHTSPFEVDFYDEIIRPDAIKLALPGFYDGGDIWKIRFSHTREGEWTITSHSDVLHLDNQHVTVEYTKKSENKIWFKDIEVRELK